MKNIILFTAFLTVLGFSTRANSSYQSTSLITIAYFTPQNTPCWGETAGLQWSIVPNDTNASIKSTVQKVYINSNAGVTSVSLSANTINIGPLWQDPAFTLYAIDANGDTCYMWAPVTISDKADCYGLYLTDLVSCGASSNVSWYQNVDADSTVLIAGNDTIGLSGSSGRLITAPLFDNMQVQLLCSKLGHTTSFQTTIYTTCATAATATATTDVSTKNEIALYPNPATDKFMLTSGAQMQKVELFNTVGQKVSEQQLQSTSAQIVTTTLLPGTYFVRITTAEGQKTMTVVKN